MADNFLAEIRIVGFTFAPKGWAFCNGQLLPLSQNTALFSLLGTTYGGDGRTTFALPNLQGCAPLHFGQGSGLNPYVLGQIGGEAAVSLALSQLPQHTHTASANASNGDVNNPVGSVWAKPHLGKTPVNIYSSAVGVGALPMSGLAPAGGSLPHNNMPPYLTLNFVIALQGIFPSRS